MTIQIAPVDLMHTAVLDMLRSTSGGIKIFDGNPYGTVSSYQVLHDLGAPPPSGPPMAGDGADLAILYQLDSIGRTRVEAQALGRRGRERMVQSNSAGGFLYPVTVTGWRCSYRAVEAFLGVNAEGREPRQVFVDRTKYRFHWTPA